jgi:hypothetical protein
MKRRPFIVANAANRSAADERPGLLPPVPERVQRGLDAVLRELNNVIQGPAILDPDRFAYVPLRKETVLAYERTRLS